jgi:hypothetical protein
MNVYINQRLRPLIPSMREKSMVICQVNYYIVKNVFACLSITPAFSLFLQPIKINNFLFTCIMKSDSYGWRRVLKNWTVSILMT